MKLRHFVSGSSVILAGWLAVTFFYHVPAQRYQKLEKYPATSAMQHPATREYPGSGTESGDLQVSVSR